MKLLLAVTADQNTINEAMSRMDGDRHAAIADALEILFEQVGVEHWYPNADHTEHTSNLFRGDQTAVTKLAKLIEGMPPHLIRLEEATSYTLAWTTQATPLLDLARTQRLRCEELRAMGPNRRVMAAHLIAVWNQDVEAQRDSYQASYDYMDLYEEAGA